MCYEKFPAAMLAVLALAGCGSVAGQSGSSEQATASCYVGVNASETGNIVNVTFNNPTSQPLQPSWVAVVTYNDQGGEDWSFADWMPAGYPSGGYVVAAGQKITYPGSEDETPPADATSCQVASWRAVQ